MPPAPPAPAPAAQSAPRPTPAQTPRPTQVAPGQAAPEPSADPTSPPSRPAQLVVPVLPSGPYRPGGSQTGLESGSSRAPRQRRSGWVLPVAAVVVLVVVGGLIFLLAGRAGGQTPATSAGSGVGAAPTAPTQAAGAPVTPAKPAPSPAPATVTVTQPVDAESAARAELATLREQSLAGFGTSDQWVVQLASKWHGIQDPYQTTPTGNHVFTVVDILAEHKALRSQFGGAVRLLSSTDLGKQLTYPAKPAGETLWVTIYDPGNLASKSAATGWCVMAFPTRSGEDLRNVCYPKQASAPHV